MIRIATTSILTAIIAAFVAFIGWLQWRTAEEKVRLDLFDRRFALYEELRAIILQYLGGVGDPKSVEKFARAASRAQFLFGPEVTTFLEERRKDLNLEVFARHLEPDRPIPEDRRAAVEDAHVARLDHLGKFVEDFDELVSPYMKHHQKAGLSGMSLALASTANDRVPTPAMTVGPALKLILAMAGVVGVIMLVAVIAGIR